MANGWWNNNGAISGCIAAYQPIGADSLAASYTNLANAGTYDAAPGVAPGWGASTGWTFNGTTQYLTLGIPAETKPVSFIMRLTPGASSASLQAPLATSVSGGLMFDFRNSGTINIRFLKMNVVVIGQTTDTLTQNVSAVVGITYGAAGAWAIYVNGSGTGSGTNNQTPTASTLWVSGQSSRFFQGNVAALAVYNVDLLSADVATVSAAMALLPVASGQPAAIRGAFVPGMYSGGRRIVRAGWGA